MPRSRVPSVYPTIQLFLRATTASIELTMFVMLIILSTRKVNLPAFYCAAIYCLILDIQEILGLTSASRKIPRIWGGLTAFTEFIALILWAVVFMTWLVGAWGRPESDERRLATEPWHSVVLFMAFGLWPMHFVFWIMSIVDCCTGGRRKGEDPVVVPDV